MAETAVMGTWQFLQECPVPRDVSAMLARGEEPRAAFKTVRDVAVFTTKRLIVRDAQGLTGTKVEIYSLPWKSVQLWSSENAGKMLDSNAEVELWTLIGHFKINLKKGIDIRKIDALIADCVLA